MTSRSPQTLKVKHENQVCSLCGANGQRCYWINNFGFACSSCWQRNAPPGTAGVSHQKIAARRDQELEERLRVPEYTPTGYHPDIFQFYGCAHCGGTVKRLWERSPVPAGYEGRCMACAHPATAASATGFGTAP